MSINRRHLLFGGAALALGSSGALWFASQAYGSSTWIEAVVRRHLSGLELDSASLQQFATTLARDVEFRNSKVELALNLDSLAPALVRIAPEVGAKIERLERHVISQYLLGSNFFRVRDPRAERIYFSAAIAACVNPFAIFRND
jgi:hypothetical protein